MTNIIGGKSRAAISNRVDDISSAASQIADSVNKGVQARLGAGAKRNHGNILRYPLDLDKESVLSEMQSGDYEHLIQTFDKYFGMIVDLER